MDFYCLHIQIHIALKYIIYHLHSAYENDMKLILNLKEPQGVDSSHKSIPILLF